MKKPDNQDPEWDPEMYVKVDETLTLTYSTTKGAPITYRAYWDDGSDSGNQVLK